MNFIFCIPERKKMENAPIDLGGILRSSTMSTRNVSYSSSQSADVQDQFVDDRYKAGMEVLCALLTIIGVCGNIVTFFTIIWSKKMHTVTYTVVASLAPPDIISLVFGYCFVYRLQDEFFLRSYTLRAVVRGIGMAGEHASAAHMVFLAGVRCLMIAKPLWCHANLRPKNIMMASCAIWLFSVCFASGVMTFVYLSESGHFDQKTILFTFFTLSIYLFCIPPIFILIFHCLKIRIVKRSKAMRRSQLSSQMSMVFLLILIAYIVTCAADLVYQLAALGNNILEKSFQVTKVMFYVQYGIYVLWMIHYSLNPFIYFFVSPQVKVFIQELCNDNKNYWSSVKIRKSNIYTVKESNFSTSSTNSAIFSNSCIGVFHKKEYFSM
ncbi:proto-oncogene Mas-like [Saccostrea cucullata]|uniref:proto-oncogene Mas-like n=1 Tax=Saccostrea cuccullata TaxID=36930 RepID=UPI002ED2D03A